MKRPPVSVAVTPAHSTRASPLTASLARPRSETRGTSNHVPAAGDSRTNSGGAVSRGTAGGDAGGTAGGDAGGMAGGDAGGAGVLGRRQRARARRSVSSFLRCFFTKARRAFAERCVRKNARRRDAIPRLNTFSRLVSALHDFVRAAAAMGSPAGRAPASAAADNVMRRASAAAASAAFTTQSYPALCDSNSSHTPNSARSQLVHHDHATLEWTAPAPREGAAWALEGSDRLSENCQPDCPEIAAAGAGSGDSPAAWRAEPLSLCACLRYSPPRSRSRA